MNSNEIKLRYDFAVKFIEEHKNDFSNLELRQTYKEKADGVDLIARLDEKLEKEFLRELTEKFPEDCLYSEEVKRVPNLSSRYNWYMDPIDGTKYLYHGIPFWNISIGLESADSENFGLIYNPSTEQLFSALNGDDAKCNQEKIQITTTKELAKMEISWDFVPLRSVINGINQDTLQEKILNLHNKLYTEAYRVRNYGCGAMSLAWLAKGFLGAYISPCRPKAKFVDLMAGINIATAAGASFNEIDISDEYHTVIVASPAVIDKITDMYIKFVGVM